MCLCVAADGDVLGDGGDSSAHDRHAAGCLVPHVRHHEGLRRESVRQFQNKKVYEVFGSFRPKSLLFNYQTGDVFADCLLFVICYLLSLVSVISVCSLISFSSELDFRESGMCSSSRWRRSTLRTTSSCSWASSASPLPSTSGVSTAGSP